MFFFSSVDHAPTSKPATDLEAGRKDGKSTSSSSVSGGGGGLFKPFATLGTLPGVFRRFSQYRRLPANSQPESSRPKDKIEHELGRLTNKIVSQDISLTITR